MSANGPSTRTRFYPLIAIVLVAFIIIGFSRTYYLRFLFDLPPMKVVLQIHGLVFTAWLALFVVQTQLIAAQRVDLHMRLGIVAAILALAVVVSGLAAMLVSAATPRMTQLGVTSAQASIVPLVTNTLFAVLIVAGITFRHRASLHRRFMLLAVISAISPATARIIVMLGARPHALLIQMAVLAAFVTACLVYDWRRNRVVHPVFAIGGIVLVLLGPVRYAVARSEIWQPAGQWIANLGKYLVY